MRRARSRGMGSIGKMIYAFGIIAFVALAAAAALPGWWSLAIASIILGSVFALSAPFVIARRYRGGPNPPDRRPVVRRRQ